MQVKWLDKTEPRLMDQQYVWHRKGKAKKENNAFPTVKHGRDCGVMDSLKYQVILKKNVMPSVYEDFLARQSSWAHVQVNQSSVQKIFLECCLALKKNQGPHRNHEYYWAGSFCTRGKG